MVFSVLFYMRVIFKVIVERLGLQYVFTFITMLNDVLVEASINTFSYQDHGNYSDFIRFYIL